MPDVLIITVNYKGAEATAAFLASALQLHEFHRARVIVVENGSQDGSAERLRPLVAGRSNVELIESSTNRGYLGGAKWALQRYLERAAFPDWVIICNNDIVFDDPQFLAKLLRRDSNGVGMIAPAIIARLTGADCNPFMRNRPTSMQLLRMRIWHSSYYFMWVKQMLSPYIRSARYLLFPQAPMVTGGSTAIYGPHGAFFIFSRAYFEAGGYIDDGHFLYAEELCIAEICLALKLPVLHDPELRVAHQGHQVTGRWLNRDMYEYAKEGLHYALQKYFWANSASIFVKRNVVRPSAAPINEARTHAD